MTVAQTTPEPTSPTGRPGPRWSQLVALLLVVILLGVLPLTLWRHWENAAVPSAALTSNLRVSKKAQTGRIKNDSAATNGEAGGQPASSVTQFIYSNAAGVELARMAPVALQGIADSSGKADQRSVLLTVAIRNTGNQPLQLSPELFSLTDGRGATYPVSTGNERNKTGGGKTRPQKVGATPAAEERTREREPKPEQTGRKQNDGSGTGNNGRAATPAANQGKSGSGGKKQGAEQKQDSLDGTGPVAATLERQVLPPGGELRAGLPFVLPALARPGQLIFTPEPDRSLIVADLNALLGGSNTSENGGGGSAHGTPAAVGTELP